MDLKPGKRRRRAVVRLAHRAGIEMTHAADRFVAGHMGMPVQSERCAGRRDRNRSVREVKGESPALEKEAFRSEAARIAIAADRVERRTQPLQLAEDLRVADVAEVPDFISLRQDRA